METIWTITGAAIVLVSLTLCIAIAAVCVRMLIEEPSEPALARYHTGILAGSVALFGILITAVFFITAFRIDEGVEDMVTQQVSPVLDDELIAFRNQVEQILSRAISAEAQQIEARALGAWEQIPWYGEPQQANSSGFIFAFISPIPRRPNLNSPLLNFHVGESADAMKEVQWLYLARDSALVPVRAGQYWEITGNERGFENDAEIHWIPMFGS